MKTRLLLKMTTVFCLVVSLANAQTEITLPFHETFNYPPGGLFQLNTNQGLGSWYTTAPRTSGSPIQQIEASTTTWSLTSNLPDATNNMLDLRSFGENPELHFPLQTGDFGDLFVSMFIEIDGYSTNFNTQTGRFLFQLNGVGAVWARGTADAGGAHDGNEDIEFGISSNASTAPVGSQWTGDKFVVGDQLFLVFSFSRNAGVESAKLWINPVVNGVEPVATATDNTDIVDTIDFNFFKIDVVNSAGSPDMLIDEVRIGKNWNDVSPVKPLPPAGPAGPVAATITTATTPIFPVYESFDNYAVSAKLVDNNAETGIGAWGTKNQKPVTYANVITSPIWGSLGTDTGVNNAGNALNINGDPGNANEDAYLQFTNQSGASNTVYTSFLMKVTDVSSINTTAYRLVGLARKNATSVSGATHLFVRKGATATTYNIGVNEDNGTTDIPEYVGGATPVEYTEGQELFVVLYYDFTGSSTTGKLWINPVISGAEPAPDATDGLRTLSSVDVLLFTQNADTNTPNVTFDEIRIANTWDEVTKVKHTLMGTSSDWNTSGSWDNGIVPGTLSNVILPAGTSGVIGATTGAKAHNLTIDAAADLSMTAGGALQLTGLPTGELTYNVAVADDEWHLVSSPVIGQVYNDTWVTANGVASGSVSATNRGIATYDNTTNDPVTSYWSYMQEGTSDTFSKIEGYSLKKTSVSGGTYSFTGAFPRFNYNVPITQAAGNNWNLVGNPYPSYINIADFIASNAAKLGGAFQALYVWNAAAGGGTGAYENKTTGFLHPGQAFFVSAGVASHNLDFTESLQSAQTGVTFYKGTSNSKINLKISAGELESFTEINFLENATNGLNPGQDFGMFTGVKTNLAVYSHLLEDNTGIPLKNQSLSLSNTTDLTIPIGIIAKSGSEITFTAESFDLPAGVSVVLEDKLTNTKTDLSIMDSKYTLKLTEDVNGVGRFFLSTASSSLSVFDTKLENISIFKKDIRTLRIVGVQQGKVNVKLYNILGKLMLDSSFTSNGVNDVALPKLATGVYVVQLETELGKLNKKIILE